MATELQLRRDNTAKNIVFTGAAGEVVVDNTKRTLVVHDGSTAGGNPLATELNANLAFNLANTAMTVANLAFNLANNDSGNATAAFAQANAGYLIANAGIIQANTARDNSNTAVTISILAFAEANAAVTNGAASFAIANAASATAIAAFTQANTANTTSVASFAAANTNATNITSNASILTAAFGAANNRVLKTGDNVSGNINFSVANVGYTWQNTFSITLTSSNVLSHTANTDLNLFELRRFKAKNYTSVKNSPTIAAGVLTLNLTTGNIFDVALNANITTLTISNPDTSGHAELITLIFTADGSARTVVWGGSVKWAGGSAPTLTSVNGKRDVFAFLSTDNGTTWIATIIGQNF